MLTGGGIDTCDPQCAEYAFFLAPVTVGILRSLGNSLFGYPVNVLAAAAIALGLGKNFLVSGMGGDPTFDSWHDGFLLTWMALTVWQHARDCLLVAVMKCDDTAQLAFTLAAFLGQDVAAMRLAMQKLA